MQTILSIPINAPPETVFSWIGSPEKAQTWMTSVAESEIYYQAPGMLGTTFREVVQDSGSSLEIAGKVTGYVENQLIAFHLDSHIHALDVEYRVEAAQGGSLLTADTDIHWKFPMSLMALFIGSKIREGIEKQTMGEFGRLKEICEGG